MTPIWNQTKQTWNAVDNPQSTPRDRKCPECGGSKKCIRCGGSGSGNMDTNYECPHCRGYKICPRCDGTGYLR